jgi:transposase
MSSPIENATRREIIRRHEQGESLRSISSEMGMSYETVKKLWRHWVKKGSIEPNYEAAKQRGTRQYGQVYAQAVQLKRDHPRWGAPLIRLKLQAQSNQTLPSVRTLQRWFREAGVNRAAQIRQRRMATVQRGQQVHQVWAVDAKERMRLQDGSWASWLVVTDEASGAVLKTDVFPPALLDTD